jgi:hypothetical protein
MVMQLKHSSNKCRSKCWQESLLPQNKTFYSIFAIRVEVWNVFSFTHIKSQGGRTMTQPTPA